VGAGRVKQVLSAPQHCPGPVGRLVGLVLAHAVLLGRAGDLHDPRALASVGALPFADSTFDVVMSAWVIETVDSPSAAVAEMLRVLQPGGLLAYSFCSRPARRWDRWRTGPTRAVVHALFAGHFLREEQTPFHDCATSRRSSFAAGAASVVLLGKCCTVAAVGAQGVLTPAALPGEQGQDPGHVPATAYDR